MAASHYRFICNGVKQIVEKINIPKMGQWRAKKSFLPDFQSHRMKY
jgi:hypothetical protein